jgi:hypothetical protein
MKQTGSRAGFLLSDTITGLADGFLRQIKLAVATLQDFIDFV